MIPKEQVKEEMEEVLKGRTEPEFLREAVHNVILFLKNQSPDFWKNYGMYWWNMMDVFKKYDAKDFKSYSQMQGSESVFGSDIEMKERFIYGSDAMNFVAAQMYLEERATSFGLGADNPHPVEDEEGNERMYIPSIGFVDEREW